MDTITLLSPAKINLIFEIVGKREDGYHEIRSLIQPVDIFDKVEINTGQGTGVRVSMTGLDLSNPGDNIAYKAAVLFLERSRIQKSVNISISKRIPAGAGLGGGSSNAASVLVGLNRLTDALEEEDLFELASRLGADVPLFIRCTTSYVEGIGEKVTTLKDFPLLYYVVIYPYINISTGEIYEKWDKLKPDHVNHRLVDENRYKLFTGFQTTGSNYPLYNDLEYAAFELYPALEHYKELLQSFGADSALMTGSGSAVYAVFDNGDAADVIYDYLKTSEKFLTFKARGIRGWHRLVT